MSMDLETPASAPEPAAPEPASAPPVAAAAAPEPVVPADPDEAAALEVQGGKYVPLDALKAAREEAKVAKARAAEVDTLRGQVQQLTGSLQTFQHLQRELAQPARPAESAPPQTDPRLLEYAKSLDYYTADGKPDVDRAAKFASLVQQEARALAGQAVAPLAEAHAQQQSFRNYQQALLAGPSGVKPKVETINWIWQNTPASYTADPRTAMALQALAIGLDMMGGTGALPPAPAAPASPPIGTEGPGHPPARSRVSVSDAERAVLTARGMDEAQYVKHTQSFRAGRLNTLED